MTVGRVPRAVLVVLAGGHVALLGGAYLVLSARAGPVAIAGALLISLGVGIEMGVAAWSAGRIRRAARELASLPSAASIGAGATPRRRQCFACGWSGVARHPVCPRCGRMVVPVRGASATSGPPEEAVRG